MSEIKSTLDLVMARTRHLTLSRKEKAEQQLDVARKQVRGWLQQHLDGLLKTEEILEKMQTLQVPEETSGPNLLVNDIWQRLSLEDLPTSRALLDLLGIHQRASAEQARMVLKEYQTAMDGHHQDGCRKQLALLASQDHISGSAIAANPASQPEWQQQAMAIAKQFAGKLADVRPR